ncbi:hypothetical protein CPLU01_02165 [Colletotrichum plurivorum]|uniref:C2H2-type domain-containing protein n=1 Tax=Colletotrichum plurivorum TaxID=2175906 RepID=A0A8H6NN98_9PEZI|nr:hypothetical protein CPLU01_02165 [Colletotrichum plurivorum]
MAMETPGSFTARRPAASALPALPPFPPTSNQDIPSTSRPPHQYPLNYHTQNVQSSPPWQSPAMIPPSASASSSSAATSNTHHSPNTASSGLTSPSGVTGEGLSPLSSGGIHTTSSQNSQYYAGAHGAWPTPSTSSYQLSSTPQSMPQGHNYPSRASSTYEQQSPITYTRTSQSPATGGDGLPAPQYGTGPAHHPHHPYQPGYSAGAVSTPVSLPSQAPNHASILSSQASAPAQLPTPGAVSSHVDSYAQSRPPASSGYYTTSPSGPQQPTYSPYQPHPSPHAAPPTTSAGSGRLTLNLNMAPPVYQPHQRYFPPMPASVLSNLSSPGHQMSLVPGMGMPPYAQHHLSPAMYGHGHGHGGQQNSPAERPFKCDQCPQSFNRNHDLKRHKRIHLAVKPFPCNYCDKSFSRKDALKRHRLVKGCGSEENGDAAKDKSMSDDRSSPKQD